jgi:hypothetical protein
MWAYGGLFKQVNINWILQWPTYLSRNMLCPFSLGNFSISSVKRVRLGSLCRKKTFAFSNFIGKKNSLA